MRRILILVFFACAIFSQLCFAESYARRNDNFQSNFAVSKANNEFPNIFRSIEDLFRRIFRKNHGIYDTSIGVENLILSFEEITMACSTSNVSQNKSCPDIKGIAVFTTVDDQKYADEVTYSYTVSGGKIIGKGSKVVWDLSNVKPGTYIITSAVDDGCGFCGQTKTKTVIVKECPDCKDE